MSIGRMWNVSWDVGHYSSHTVGRFSLRGLVAGEGPPQGSERQQSERPYSISA